jgi:hypothetical protein
LFRKVAVKNAAQVRVFYFKFPRKQIYSFVNIVCWKDKKLSPLFIANYEILMLVLIGLAYGV